MAFEAGDVVVLKSGGHAMTVIAIEEQQAECIWTGEDGDLFRETIPTVALEIAQEIDADDEAEDEEHEDDIEEEHEDEEGHAEKELNPA